MKARMNQLGTSRRERVTAGGDETETKQEKRRVEIKRKDSNPTTSIPEEFHLLDLPVGDQTIEVAVPDILILPRELGRDFPETELESALEASASWQYTFTRAYELMAEKYEAAKLAYNLWYADKAAEAEEAIKAVRREEIADKERKEIGMITAAMIEQWIMRRVEGDVKHELVRRKEQLRRYRSSRDLMDKLRTICEGRAWHIKAIYERRCRDEETQK